MKLMKLVFRTSHWHDPISDFVCFFLKRNSQIGKFHTLQNTITNQNNITVQNKSKELPCQCPGKYRNPSIPGLWGSFREGGICRSRKNFETLNYL